MDSSAVYSPKWIKGLTLSADFPHIDLRSIASFVDPQFIIDFEIASRVGHRYRTTGESPGF